MLSKSHEIVVICILISGQLISQAALTQGLSTITSVEEKYEIDNPGELSWTIVASSLSQCTFGIITGKLGDMFGHKKLFVFGYFILCFWSLITCISYFASSSFFFISRGFQGFGSSFLLPNGLAIVGRHYENCLTKTIIYASFAAAIPIGSVLGAVIGALFTTTEEWFWIYFIMFSLGGILTILSFVFLPTDKFEKDSSNSTFDYLGAVSFVVAIFAFNISFNLAAMDGWQKPYCYILLIVGVFSLVSLIYVQMKNEHPLIPKSLFNFTALKILSSLACGFSAFGIWMYYVWVFMVPLKGNAPLLATAEFCPLSITSVSALVLTTYLFLKEMKSNLIMLIGLTCMLISLILLATAKEDTSYWGYLFVSTLIAPFGVVLVSTTAVSVLNDMVDSNQQGISSALIISASSISFGLGISGNAVKYSEPESDLQMVRTACYVGLGLCCLGIIIEITGVITDFVLASKRTKPEEVVSIVEQSGVKNNELA
ncbi:unnamed protein product [Wickerhamomyces anomalus]